MTGEIVADRVVIRGAAAADLPAVEALLAAARLPLAGVAEHFADFMVAERSGRVVGVVGLERYGDAGLLRSAVTARRPR